MISDSNLIMSSTTPKHSPVLPFAAENVAALTAGVSHTGSGVIRAVSPPTPAPSPRPEQQIPQQHLLHAYHHSDGTLTPSQSPERQHEPPGTPVSPGGEQSSQLESFQDDEDEAAFAERFIDSVVAHFPRLTLPERRKLFSSLLPALMGEDMLHLSQLVSPYLRRDFISELPAEIALHILAFVDDPKDLVRASRVSRTWRALVSDEQTWKMMLEKYRGRGAGAASLRPPLERIRMQHPEANFGTITSPPPRTVRIESLALPPPVPPPSSSASSATSSRRASILSPNAQPFRSGQPSLHNHTMSSSSAASTASSSPIASSAEDATTSYPTSLDTVRSEGDNVNRFLDENQTPLAGRNRKRADKCKSRARDANDSGEAYASGSGTASTSAAAASSASGHTAPITSGVLPDGHAYWQLRGLGFSARRQSHASPLAARSPNAPPTRPLVSQPLHSREPVLPPPPQELLPSQMSYLSLTQAPGGGHISHSVDSGAISPSATFAPAYHSPAVITSSTLSTSGLDPRGHNPTSPVAYQFGRHVRDQVSPSFTSPFASSSRYQSTSPEASTRTLHSVSTSKPKKFINRRSMNPFGTSVTSHQNPAPFGAQASSTPSTQSSFSYKAQFKKAYLTESNWLRGPGRLLSRQTSSDDGVVTSLGFDNEWIVIGMANKQIHVFDARTGEYVRELVGHTLGVWALVLVSKGGERLNEHGKRVHVDRKQPSFGTSWESDSEDVGFSGVESESSMDDSASSPISEVHQRSRSASARPPNVEKFFTQVSASSSPSPDSLAPQGTPSLSTSVPASAGIGRTQSSPLVTPDRNKSTDGPSRPNPSTTGGKTHRSRRPSSFCGLSSMNDYHSHSSSSGPSRTGFPFGGDEGGVSAQQAAACGTANGWGQAGAIAVTGGCDRDVRVWDVTTGRCLHVLRGHGSTVRCLKVLDGRPVAISGSRDATLRVWDIEKGKQLRVLAGHQHSVRCIEISGNHLVSGSYDTTCRVWDVDTGECLHLLQGHQHQIYAVAFDGQRVASGSLDSTVRIWSAKTGECLALLQGHTSLVGQLQLTDSVLVTGGSDGRVIVFSLSTFECLHRLCAHDNSVTCLQFNDRFMVTGGNDGRVKLWDRPSGKLIRELAEPCEAVWRVTFREDKCVLLCKRQGRTVMDVRTFAPTEEEI